MRRNVAFSNFLSGIVSLLGHELCTTLSDDSGVDTKIGLTKGFILSCVLMVVCDSMAMAGWIACILLLCRLVMQLFSLCVECKNLSDIGETGSGLFIVVFGYTGLENARIAGPALIPFLTKRTNWTAFEERRHALVQIPMSSQVV
jgi:hypothetical protein